MPIRVPQIIAQQVPDTAGGPRIDPGTLGQYAAAPARALAQGVGTLSETIQQVAHDYARVQDALTKQEMKLDIDDKLTTVRDRLTQEDIALRQEGVDPDQLAEQLRQRGTRVIGDVARDLRYPQSAVAFQNEANKLLGAEVIKQRYRGLDLKFARIGVLTAVQNQEDVNTAIFGATPAERDAALEQLNARITEMVGTGIWSQAKAESETLGMLAQIELGRARKDARDPRLRPAVLDRLLTGQLPHVRSEAQAALADTLMREMEAEQKELEDRKQREAEAERKRQVDLLDEQADDGTLTAEGLRQAIDQRVVVGDDARRLRKALRERGAAGGRSDDEVYNRLELDLLENPHSHAPREIRRIQEQGKLAASGPRSAATLLKLIDEGTTAAAGKDVTQEHLFKQGLHELRQSLRGGAGPLESLTREAATRLENAEREYHDLARSGKIPLPQLPEVARRIVDRLRRQSPLQMGDPEMRSLLRYQTPAELLAAKKQNLIPPAEFNRQMDLMKRLGIFTETPTTPTAPREAPSGRR